MKIIVCLDDKNGMLFNRRRQSKDSILREKLLEKVGNETVWMNAYSASQFPQTAPNMKIDELFLEKAGQGEYCFVENVNVTEFAPRVEELTVYRWNRAYPADTKFPIELFEKRGKLISRVDFAGSSHERITEEVYVL